MKASFSLIILPLIFIKIGLAAYASVTIGTSQTFLLSIALDVIFLSTCFFYNRNLLYSYFYVGIFCTALYVSYYLSDGAYFTAGGDDGIYYGNFLIQIDKCELNHNCDVKIREDISTKILAAISSPFRLLGFNFFSPLDYFLLQSACLAPLGPLFLQLAKKVINKELNLIYIIAFTPYWYYGIVGREWPLYYAAICTSLVYVSNLSIVVKQIVILLCFYLSFLVRIESGIIFIVFMLFQLHKKNYPYVFILLMLTLLFFFEDANNLLQFAILKSNEIYFSGVENSNGLGGLIKYSDNLFLKPVFFFYLIFSPIPPFFFHVASFENLLLLVGQLIWPIIVLASLIQGKKLIQILKDYSVVRGALFAFVFVIFLLAFFGGTQRHYYPFIPHLLLILPLMVSARNKPWTSFIKMPSLFIVSLLIAYLLLIVAT